MGNSDSKWVKDVKESAQVGGAAGTITAAVVTVVTFVYLISRDGPDDDKNKKV
jgi:hypothetical protein